MTVSGSFLLTIDVTFNAMQHQFDFDPTYGYSEAELRAIGCPSAPADFEPFWRNTRVQADAVQAKPTCRLIRASGPIKIYEVEFDALDCDSLSLPGVIRIGGWMTLPASGLVTRGLIVGHGYGGRSGPDLSPLAESAAILYPCARGFGRSARKDIPDSADRHVLHGIATRETYVHRGCVVDIWAAVRALVQLEPATAEWICYAGESFGGGIGALALPWEPAFKRAFFDFPSFGQHPLRLQMPCVGSGEAIRKNGGQQHLSVLRYFDAATAATFTRIPVLVGAALFDPAVPPPGQFAIYNCLKGEKKLFTRQAAHFDWPGSTAENRVVRQQAIQWLNQVAV